MTQVITAESETGDGVFTEGDLHNITETMTSTELTLDQLQSINGGGIFSDICDWVIEHVSEDTAPGQEVNNYVNKLNGRIAAQTGEGYLPVEGGGDLGAQY